MKKVIKHKCIDCGKNISHDAKRCKSCNMRNFWKKNILQARPFGLEKLPLQKGKKFYNLTVIKLHHITNKYSRSNFYYLCVCDCGKEKIIDKQSLIGGDTRSCGCYHAIRCGEAHRKKKGEASFNRVYSLFKNTVGRRGIKCSLSKQEFKLITSQNCKYCNAEPINNLKHNSRCYGVYNYNGIDRIDSNLPYTYENCVPCCKYCNYAKNDMSTADFLNHIKKIYEYNQK